MKKLLCIMALLVAFQPDAFAQRQTRITRDGNTVTKTTVVQQRGRTVRKTVVVERRPRAERRVVRHRHGPPMVRCRDGVLKRDRPGACRGHGGRR
jgi:hypothetical protein